jgi:hypothetical protein
MEAAAKLPRGEAPHAVAAQVSAALRGTEALEQIRRAISESISRHTSPVRTLNWPAIRLVWTASEANPRPAAISKAIEVPV